MPESLDLAKLQARILTLVRVSEESTSETIAEQLDSPIKSVQAALRELVAKGFLERNFFYVEVDGSTIGRYVYRAVL